VPHRRGSLLFTQNAAHVLNAKQNGLDALFSELSRLKLQSTQLVKAGYSSESVSGFLNEVTWSLELGLYVTIMRCVVEMNQEGSQEGRERVRRMAMEMKSHMHQLLGRSHTRDLSSWMDPMLPGCFQAIPITRSVLSPSVGSALAGCWNSCATEGGDVIHSLWMCFGSLRSSDHRVLRACSNTTRRLLDVVLTEKNITRVSEPSLAINIELSTLSDEVRRQKLRAALLAMLYRWHATSYDDDVRQLIVPKPSPIFGEMYSPDANTVQLPSFVRAGSGDQSARRQHMDMVRILAWSTPFVTGLDVGTREATQIMLATSVPPQGEIWPLRSTSVPVRAIVHVVECDLLCGCWVWHVVVVVHVVECDLLMLWLFMLLGVTC